MLFSVFDPISQQTPPRALKNNSRNWRSTDASKMNLRHDSADWYLTVGATPRADAAVFCSMRMISHSFTILGSSPRHPRRSQGLWILSLVICPYATKEGASIQSTTMSNQTLFPSDHPKCPEPCKRFTRLIEVIQDLFYAHTNDLLGWYRTMAKTQWKRAEYGIPASDW